MKQLSTKLLIVFLALCLAAGCAQQAEPPPDSPENAQQSQIQGEPESVAPSQPEPPPAPEPEPEPAPAPEPVIDVQVVMERLTRTSRFVGTAENRAACGYLEGEFAKLGLLPLLPDRREGYLWPYRQVVEGRELTPDNLVGYLPGRDSTRAVVVASHVDSERNTPGAVDNASGVAAMLKVADLLRMGEEPALDVIFCCFNGEEQFYKGALAFVPELATLYGEMYMINLDCVGMADNSGYMLASAEGAPDDALCTVLRAAFEAEGLPLSSTASAGITADHRSFLDAGYPAATVTQAGLYAIYHTPQDSIDKVDFAALDKVSAVVAAFITQSGGELYAPQPLRQAG